MEVGKKHIFLSNTVETAPYSSLQKRGSFRLRDRDVRTHADLITRKLRQSNQDDTLRRATAVRYREGVYLEFTGAPDHDLATKSLENRRQGIRLLNVQEDGNVTKALVYIPAGKESYFLQKVEAYASRLTPAGKPRNKDLVESIEDVRLAVFRSFWTGNTGDMPTDVPVWCEVWLRYDYDQSRPHAWEQAEENFLEVCREHGISVNEKNIVFPERIIKLALANKEKLEMIINSCPYVAEIRRAQEPATSFAELLNTEQKEWVEELLGRVLFEDNGVAICLLDTGLTSSHPLLNEAIQNNGIQAVKPEWGSGDHHGHGTEMAGIALYWNVKQALEDTRGVQVRHTLESLKILPRHGDNPHELYGAITQQAASLAEIANPHTKRVFCMAVTSEEFNTGDGSPTSWSAAVDSITSGAEEEDVKRLFFVSAGNVLHSELVDSDYIDANALHGVESPGQAWNAITVGAYSDSVTITDPDYEHYYPVADAGQLSPYSSTSSTWGKTWPIKPEILLDGGNMATDGLAFVECPDLSLLTTYYRPLVSQFSTTSGTSPATAQAAWMAAQLMAEYPHAWPETVRALIIHSADWTDKMKEQFCRSDTKTRGRRRLLRHCGYGIPDLERAIQCMNNSVNLVIQGELQPFKEKSMNEMHFHTLPWPTEQLLSLGEVPVTLKVTLSYFIEPGPGEVGWKDKYRYPSCGLRFDVINENETPGDFKKRVNVKMRGEDKKDKGEGTSGSERWYLGADNRDVGSIHSDFCELSAAELCECNVIAVYPVIGWWRERAYLGKHDSRKRYSLVVSLSTPKVDVDLYTPIVTKIQSAVEIDVPTN
jgi:hypothetical protein